MRLGPLLALSASLALAAPTGARAEGPTTAPAASPAPAKSRKLLERVVAVVNDTIILESDLDQAAAPLGRELASIQDPRERQRQTAAIRRQALKELVDSELVLQAAGEAKLEVSDAEVDKALEEVKRQNNLTDRQLADALQAQGTSIPQYRKSVLREILRLRAINVLVRPRVAVTDDEVREQYDKMIGKSSSVTQVRVRHILIALPDRPTPDEMAKARRLAGELVSRARAGEDWNKLVSEYSKDEKTKKDAGELGTFKRGELPTEWEEVLFSMNDGEVRGPIRGPQGLHIFQVVEAKKEALRPFAEVKEQLRAQLFNEELEKQTKVWIEELRKKAHIETKI